MLDLTIVIVNYRAGGLTIDCLHSIMADPSLPIHTRVMVVDVVSGDRSSQMIAAAIEANAWQDTIALVDLPINGGFAYGNNHAIAAADALWGEAQAYLLLNPDTVVRAGATGALFQFLLEHPKAGIVGSALEDPDGTRQACAFRFPTAVSEFVAEARLGPITRLMGRWSVLLPVANTPSRADWVSGASMLVRRAVFDQVGGLDEAYFLYYEELDFIHRAADKGWQCWTVPQSRVVHLCGQSTGLSPKGLRAGRRPAYWFNSRNRYFEKHHGRWRKAVVDLAWIAGQAIWTARIAVGRRPNYDPPFLVRDFLANLTHRTSK